MRLSVLLRSAKLTAIGNNQNISFLPAILLSWAPGTWRGCRGAGERVLFIGTQFSILYTSMYSPAEAATPRA